MSDSAVVPENGLAGMNAFGIIVSIILVIIAILFFVVIVKDWRATIEGPDKGLWITLFILAIIGFLACIGYWSYIGYTNANSIKNYLGMP